MELVGKPISQAVEKLYEAFPYPKYPLLGKLRWQEGYIGNSQLAARLFAYQTGLPAAIHLREPGRTRSPILVAGAGEALPYVLRKIEPHGHRILCVDLSRKSLARARIRLAFDFKPADYVVADIDQFLAQTELSFHHIDIYGVLHHLASPSETLRLLSQRLHPNGTIRMMVYNREARRWINHLQAVGRLLGLNPFLANDRDDMRQLLRALNQQSAALAEKFGYLGKATMTNEARFVDTFMHAREAKIPIPAWYDMLAASGLRPIALFDRYGELDDLPNPLWQAPSAQELAERAADGRFENNVEMFLAHEQKAHRRRDVATPRPGFDRWMQKLVEHLKSPPLYWFSFAETRSLPFTSRLRLWYEHVDHINGAKRRTRESIIPHLPVAALQRLTRLGAILPGQVDDVTLRRVARLPISEQGELRRWPEAKSLAHSPINDLVSQLLVKRDRFTENRRHLIMQRLDKAQL